MRHGLASSCSRSVADAVVMLLLATGAAGCASGGAQTTTALRTAPAATATSARPVAPARPRVPAPRRSNGTRRPAGCRAPADVLGGVYHPARLQILATCRRVAGTVARVRAEPDGDLHIDLTVDRRYTQLLNDGNRASQAGALVVEFMARDSSHLLEPGPGDHLMITGAWVKDTDHGWNELHPVWSEQINGGATNRSGPQYGGSRPTDRSYDAAADCRTASGTSCQGYGAPTTSDSAGGNPSSGGAGGSSNSSNAGAGGGSRLRGGEFCTPTKEALYAAAGYTCTNSSDGRKRLHRH